MGQASQGPEVTDLFPRQLPFSIASVHGKGSHKYLGPRLNGTGGTAPEREEAAPTHLLWLPSLPKEALTPTEPVRCREPWRPAGIGEPLRSCQRALCCPTWNPLGSDPTLPSTVSGSPH